MILMFTVPIFVGNVFQQFYSMVDTIIVGKFVGTTALAAVGSVGTIMFLIIGFMLGLTAGFTVLTAQRFGAGDMKGMRKTVGSAAIVGNYDGNYDDHQYAWDEAVIKIYEYAIRYFCGRLSLYYGNLCGYFCNCII